VEKIKNYWSRRRRGKGCERGTGDADMKAAKDRREGISCSKQQSEEDVRHTG